MLSVRGKYRLQNVMAGEKMHYTSDVQNIDNGDINNYWEDSRIINYQ